MNYTYTSTSQINLLRQSVYLIFFAYWCFSIYLVKLGNAIPVRVLIEVIGLSIVFLLFPYLYKRFLLNNFLLTALLSIGIVGAFTTLLNGDSLSDVVIYEFKWVLQPVFHMAFAYCCCAIAGFHKTYRIVILVLSVSCAFAVLQMLDIGVGWEIKSSLNSIQGFGFQDLEHFDSLDEKEGEFADVKRSVGLSYSKIHLGYQICLLFGFFYISLFYRKFSIADKTPIVLALLLLWFLALIGTGTRSALLGVFSLLFLHFIYRSRHKVLITTCLVLFVVAIKAGLPLLQEMLDLRIIQAEDSSAKSKLALSLYGFYLFLDNPAGYGWLDDVNSHASQYWDDLMHFSGSESIFVVGLHNYIFNITHTYGILGLFIVFYTLYKIHKNYTIIVIIGLAPYYINSLFHNGGVFFGGNYIWVFLGIVKYYFDHFDALNKADHPE